MKVEGTGLAVMTSSSTTQMLLTRTDPPFRFHGSAADANANPRFSGKKARYAGNAAYRPSGVRLSGRVQEGVGILRCGTRS